MPTEWDKKISSIGNRTSFGNETSIGTNNQTIISGRTSMGASERSTSFSSSATKRRTTTRQHSIASIFIPDSPVVESLNRQFEKHIQFNPTVKVVSEQSSTGTMVLNPLCEEYLKLKFGSEAGSECNLGPTQNEVCRSLNEKVDPAGYGLDDDVDPTIMRLLSMHSSSDDWDTESVSTTRSSGKPFVLKGRLLPLGQSKIVCKPASTSDLTYATSDVSVWKAVSMENQVGATQSFIFDDLWPWPWLDVQTRSSGDYVTEEGHTFSGGRSGDREENQPPLLAQTLKTYLDSVEPCVTEEQFSIARSIVKEFALCLGKSLNDKLLAKIECCQDSKNWRRMVLPNYDYKMFCGEQVLQNISVVLPMFDDVWPAKEYSQIERSVNLVNLITDFFLLVFKGKLKPIQYEDDMTGMHQDMHDFRKLFCSARVTGVSNDLVASYFHTKWEGGAIPRHIVIIYLGRFFCVNVLDNKHNPVMPEILRKSLARVTKDAKENIEEDQQSPGLGVLTSTDKDTWCKCKEKLINLHEKNAMYMKLIDEALFVLSLDEVSVRESSIYHEAVFADGCNRWYHKGLSFYVYQNGLVTCSVNRSTQDEWPVSVLIDYVHLRLVEDTIRWDDDIVKRLSSRMSLAKQSDHQIFQQLTARESHGVIFQKPSSASVADLSGKTRELDFVVDEELMHEIDAAKEMFACLSRELLTATCEYDRFEDGMFSKKKIHPDSFAHMILHLNFFNMYYRMASIGSRIKTLLSGRHEIFRSSTIETRAWCKAMLDHECSSSKKMKLFWTAEKKQRLLRHRTKRGYGCDNHLEALKQICLETDDKLPNLFLDASYRKAGGDDNFDILAESLGTGFIAQTIVLPSKRSGYGVGYRMLNKKLFFTVSSWSEECGTSAQLFASSMKSTLEVHHDFFANLC